VSCEERKTTGGKRQTIEREMVPEGQLLILMKSLPQDGVLWSDNFFAQSNPFQLRPPTKVDSQ
jgi:hypothetical protein